MYIDWKLFFSVLRGTIFLLIPQTLILLKILFFNIISKYAHMDIGECNTEKILKIVKKAKFLYWYDRNNLPSHIPLRIRLNHKYDDCWFAYKLFRYFTMITDFFAFVLILSMLITFPMYNYEIKKFLNKEYSYYSSLEKPTSKDCIDAEKANKNFISYNDGSTCIKIEHELIDTDLLWAKFYNSVEDKAMFLRLVGEVNESNN